MEPFLELVVKLPVGILLFFLAMRFMGRKELAQSTPLDFAFAVLTANIAWDMAFTEDYNAWQMVVTVSMVCLIIYLLDWSTAKSKRFEKFLMGSPQVIIENGEVNRSLMEKERISMRELEARLRVKGVFEIENVEIAYLEVSGEISVKLRG